MITFTELMGMEFFELLRLAFLDDVAILLKMGPVWIGMFILISLIGIISRKIRKERK